jgi:hypothetical protein
VALQQLNLARHLDLLFHREIAPPSLELIAIFDTPCHIWNITYKDYYIKTLTTIPLRAVGIDVKTYC